MPGRVGAGGARSRSERTDRLLRAADAHRLPRRATNTTETPR